MKNGNSIATDPLTGLETNGLLEDKENGGCVPGPGGGKSFISIMSLINHIEIIVLHSATVIVIIRHDFGFRSWGPGGVCSKIISKLLIADDDSHKLHICKK
jgi:hypothetical protein